MQVRIVIVYDDSQAQFFLGDVRAMLRELETESVQVVCTSPPYWSLRDYGVDGQLGLEATPEEFVAEMVDVFREVRRVLMSEERASYDSARASTRVGGINASR